jgi:hypothetical protein
LLTFHTYETNLRRVDLAVETLMLLVECYVMDSIGGQKTAMPPDTAPRLDSGCNALRIKL